MLFAMSGDETSTDAPDTQSTAMLLAGTLAAVVAAQRCFVRA